MLLPDLVHLPLIVLLAMVMVSGVAAIAGLPFARDMLHSNPEKWLWAITVAAAAMMANLAVYFGFRATLRAGRQSAFLGIGRNIWLIVVPIAYLTGIALGIVIVINFYV